MAKQNLEIERRWLLGGVPESGVLSLLTTAQVRFDTIYVVNKTDLEVRIRKAERYPKSCPANISYAVCMKIGHGMVRQESPKLECSARTFLSFVNTEEVSYPRSVKRRLTIPLASGFKLELNLYEEPLSVKGLVIAEVEFKNQRDALNFRIGDLPTSIMKLVVKEVTKDQRYNGKNIAAYGRPNPE